MSQNESFDDSHNITMGGASPGVSARVLKPGDLIGGSYELKSLLGKGGMGYVFCAEHIMIQHQYALKLLAPEQLNETSRRRFETEGKAIANLNHPNIVKVYNMGLDRGDCPFYVMDLLDGRALSDGLDQGIGFDTCLDIFIQIASGLAYAHGKGIVHRDVKPSNIILLDEGSGRPHVKIVDFGIAKLLPSASLQTQSQTAIGEVFGSPLYMSPEQGQGLSVDHRSDIYSLGCTLFEILCGRPPFRGPNAMATVLMHQTEPPPSILLLRPDKNMPESIDLLLSKMMAKRLEDRYQSMQEVIHDLERLKQGKAIGRLPGASLLDRFTGYSREANLGVGRVPVIALAITVLLLSAGTCGYWYWHRKPTILLPEAAASISKSAEIVPTRSAMRTFVQSHKMITSQLVTVEDGSQKRRFDFPSGSLGAVRYGRDLRVNACRVQYLPANIPLTLEIGSGGSKDYFNNPEIIDKIGPAEFDGLYIEGTDLKGPTSTSWMQDAEIGGIAYFMQAAASWTKLKFVGLKHCVVNNEDLAPLNGCRHLQCLIVEQAKVNVADLVSQPFLGRLLRLELVQVDGIHPICKKLASSRAVESLLLCNCHATAQDLLEFCNSPGLRQLELEEENFAALIKVVPRLPSLRVVTLRGTVLSPAQITEITACPNISHLWLQRKWYTPGEIHLFKYTQPKLSFEG